MNGRELTADEFRYRAALDLCRRAVAADADADPTVALGHLAEIAVLVNPTLERGREWGVRDRGTVNPADNEQDARDWAATCFGDDIEIVSRAVLYGPWEPANGGAA